MAVVRDARGLIIMKADYADGEQYLSDQEILYKRNPTARRFVCLGEYDGLIAFPLGIDRGFEKKSEQSSIQYDASLKGSNPLLRVLYHENDSLLDDIKHTHHFSTLYLMRSWEESVSEFEKVRDFWSDSPENSTAFFFVTSLYCNGEREADSSILEDDLREIGQKHGLEFSCLVYSSLQIAEQVVVWKSDHLLDVIRAIEILYHGFEGYTRTICAVPFDRLKKKTLWPVCNGAHDDTTRVLNIRIAAKSYNHLAWIIGHQDSPFFEYMRNHKVGHYFTHGNEDCIGIAFGADCRSLYELLRILIDNFAHPIFSQGISHLETQFGIPLEPSQIKDTHELMMPANNQLLEIVVKIAGEITSLSSLEKVRQQVWHLEFSAQSRMLRQMASSYVMDSVCYLIVESLAFFCKWLRQVLKSHVTDQALYDEETIAGILKFLKGCSRLSTHMIRSDAIMQTHPALIPPADNFCTAVIDYCFAFFRKVTKHLCAVEYADDSASGDQRVFVQTLVPTLERWMRTEEQLLDNEKKKNGESSSSLLYLEVPYENMAEPYYMIASLVHEAGHYFGDRCRTDRVQAVLKCLTYRLLFQLQLKSEAQGFVYEALRSRLYLEYKGNEQKMLYLALLKAQAEEAALYFLNAEENEVGLYQHYANDPETAKENATRLLCSDYPRISGESNLHRIIESYVYLLKECYADIIMVQTLGISFQQYLRMFAFAFRPTYCVLRDDLRIRLWQRIFVVFETICSGGTLQDKRWQQHEEELAAFLNDQKGPDEMYEILWSRFIRFFREAHASYCEEPKGCAYAYPGGNDNSEYLFLPELYEIINHMRCCLLRHEMLLDSHGLRQEQQQLHDRFHSDIIKDCILEKKFLNLIKESRESTIEVLEGFLGNYTLARD